MKDIPAVGQTPMLGEINDSGQIVGFGINPQGQSMGFILTPIIPYKASVQLQLTLMVAASSTLRGESSQ